MRITYKVLAYLIAALVVVQAMAIVYAVSGLSHWVSGGGVLDESTLSEDSPSPFPEASGFGIHWMNGTMIIPIVALLLLIISFFTKVKGATWWALAIIGFVALQITLGLASESMPWTGAVHGLNALLLFSAAIVAGRRAQPPTASMTTAPEPSPAI